MNTHLLRPANLSLSDEQRGLWLGFLAIVLFGMTLPASRVSVQFFDPLTVGFGRSAIASVIAVVLLWLFKAPLPTRRQWKLLSLTAAGVVVGFPLLSSLAMYHMEASHGGVIMGILPLLTALIGALLSREHLSKQFWLCSVAGAVVVSGFAARNGVAGISPGDGLLLLGIVLSAMGYAIGGKLSKEMPGWQVICWALVVAAPISWAGYLWQGTSPVNDATGVLGWFSFLYLALVSQLFGFFLWNKGLALGGIAKVSQVQLLQPFVTLLIASVWLGEQIGLLTLVCALGVVALVYLGRRSQ